MYRKMFALRILCMRILESRRRVICMIFKANLNYRRCCVYLHPIYYFEVIDCESLKYPKHLLLKHDFMKVLLPEHPARLLLKKVEHH